MPSIANVARFVLLCGAAVASVRAATYCSNPGVRKEWRTLSTDERAEWIAAVNVRLYLSSLSYSKFKHHCQCLATQPHDPNLVATQPANVTLIPSINPESSYYDGLSTAVTDPHHAHSVRPSQIWFIYIWT